MPEPETRLRRELGLRDITLFALICIVGPRWMAFAAHTGPGSLTLWILAALLFAVPLAIAVARLTVRQPDAGGMYLWARKDFGPWHGFLCFWIYWMAIAIWFPSATIFYSGAVLHLLGIPETRAWVLPASLIATWIALGTNLVGMKVGKWTENIGGSSTWLLTGLFAALALLVRGRYGVATPMHIAPAWHWDTINSWSTIIFAMSGLETIGLMGGEIRDPARTVPRAGWLASLGGALVYCIATVSMLTILPPGRISEMSGLSEVGDEAARILHAGWLAPVVAALVAASGLGQLGGVGTAASRLPFAAGADHLLPRVFSRVHPRWGTPYAGILALGCVSSVLMIFMQAGDTLRAAYQALVSLMVIVGFLPYIYIFGCSWKSGARLSSISGQALTILAIVCAVVPTAEIGNVWLFETKLALGTAAVVVSGWLVYRRSV